MIAIVYPECVEIQGIARYLDSFLSNLPSGSPHIILITGDQHRVSREYAGVEIIHVPFSARRLKQLLWTIRVRFRLLSLYRQGRVRSVNLHVPPLVPGLCLPSRIPLILTVHTTCVGLSGRFYAQQHYKSDWSAAGLMIRTWMERAILAKATRVITLTEQGRQEITRSGYTGPIAVIPNGADGRVFTPDASVTKDIDVLFCGRLERRKGSRALVDVCKMLITQRASIRICIVGYGDREYRRVRAELAAYRGNVQLTDRLPFERMRAYYNRSRVYVSASFYEGLPGTCLEAMAMGVPAVVWDFLFYKGLVNDGHTGYLVPANDFQAMTARVMHLLDDVAAAAAMGRAARATVLARYDWRWLAGEVLAELR